MDFGPPFGLSVRLDVDSFRDPRPAVEQDRKFDFSIMFLLIDLTYFLPNNIFL